LVAAASPAIPAPMTTTVLSRRVWGIPQTDRVGPQTSKPAAVCKNVRRFIVILVLAPQRLRAISPPDRPLACTIRNTARPGYSLAFKDARAPANCRLQRPFVELSEGRSYAGYRALPLFVRIQQSNRGVKNLAKHLVGQLWKSQWLDLLPSYCVSIVAHLLALLVLAMIVFRLSPKSHEVAPVEAFENNGSDAIAPALDRLELHVDADEKQVDRNDISTTPLGQLAGGDPLAAVEPHAAPLDVRPDFSVLTGPTVRFAGELAGRIGGARAKLVARGGGTTASEKCVGLGLRWLARYQQADGNWNFHHGPDDPGSLEKCTTGATGLALLAFLGAGHTHRSEQARYRSTVDKGIRFLLAQMKRAEHDGDLRGTVVSNEGMYAQAIATLALCEAYGLTHDSKLKEPAQRAVNFIVQAQDPKGGGWRYAPHDPGDTTVTGWQVMALKSAKNSGLKVPERTLARAGHFLDAVQTREGSRYGYDRPGETPAMTAIGLLCRMYLGWTRSNPPLKRGVEYVSHTGPSRDDIYYDYYASQTLHQWGGPEWKQWNEVLRDQLVETQVKRGDAAGSWKPTGDRGAGAGGRLYQTCLSVMTLEVYYRYLPLYQQEAAKPRS